MILFHWSKCGAGLSGGKLLLICILGGDEICGVIFLGSKWWVCVRSVVCSKVFPSSLLVAAVVLLLLWGTVV